jgi:predicted phage terminase large subunit-like protein
VFAAIDFAFSLSSRADYTAIVVIGVDPDWNIYVLDIDRFKTNRIKDYFERILNAHRKWGFRKIRAEVTVAQDAIVEDLKISYIRPQGLALTIDKFRPTRAMGNKEERIAATLKPRYENGNVWHPHGTLVSELEEELTMRHPKHDDIKDALASAVAIAAPAKRALGSRTENKVVYHPRWGGVAA